MDDGEVREEVNNETINLNKGCLLSVVVIVIIAALVFSSVQYVFSKRDTQSVYEQMNSMFH